MKFKKLNSTNSANYSMEMGDVVDKNCIYFVSVGRSTDRRILLSVITNREFTPFQHEFKDQTYKIL